MRIAIPVENGMLSAHFGHCRHFALVDIDAGSGSIAAVEEVPAPDHQPGLLPKWLADLETDVVIAGGMGGRAQQLFEERGITVAIGAEAQAPASLATQYVSGTLKAGSNICDH